MPDQALIVTPEALQRLSVLLYDPKFKEEDLYPGAPTEEIRLRVEHAVNGMLDRLSVGLQESPRKSYVLAEFLEMLQCFEEDDTEEREQACTYCERVMTILGIESSDGLLNTWLYGFDPEQKP
jgi:hypothetical protein